MGCLNISDYLCAVNQNIRIMATSSKDIETLWYRYSSEASKQGISVAQSFESNGVHYHVFEKWYKKRIQTSVVVDYVVSGQPSDASVSQVSIVDSMATQMSNKSLTVSYINIGLSNGMKIEHHRLSYDEMLCFVQKLQPLYSA